MSRNEHSATGPIVPQGKAVVPARGYSPLELARAGLTEQDARRLGVALDAQRTSMIGANVMQLRRLADG